MTNLTVANRKKWDKLEWGIGDQHNLEKITIGNEGILVVEHVR